MHFTVKQFLPFRIPSHSSTERHGKDWRKPQKSPRNQQFWKWSSMVVTDTLPISRSWTTGPAGSARRSQWLRRALMLWGTGSSYQRACRMPVPWTHCKYALPWRFTAYILSGRTWACVGPTCWWPYSVSLHQRTSHRRVHEKHDPNA